MSSSQEENLLARCRAGDADAWDELFSAYYQPAARFVFQLGFELTPEDVEEICQETFLSVIRNLRDFKGGSRFQTWLFRIAANKARDYREKQHAAKRGGGQPLLSLAVQDPDTGLSLDPPSTAPAPDVSLLTSEQAALIGQALDELGEPCREIIQLRYFADLSYDEIGASLNLNTKTVSSRLSKCLDRLEVLVRKLFLEGIKTVSPSNL